MQHAERLDDTFLDASSRDKQLLVLDAERKVGADKVNGYNIIGYIVKRKLRFVRQVLVHADIVERCGAHILHGCGKLFVFLLRHVLHRRAHFAEHKRHCACDALQTASAEALYDGCEIIAWTRHFQHLHELGINAIFEKVLAFRILHFLVFLAEYGKCRIVMFAQLVQQVEALLASYDDG